MEELKFGRRVVFVDERMGEVRKEVALRVGQIVTNAKQFARDFYLSLGYDSPSGVEKLLGSLLEGREYSAHGMTNVLLCKAELSKWPLLFRELDIACDDPLIQAIREVDKRFIYEGAGPYAPAANRENRKS